jgi:CTD small phosphatase-like protein 2
MFHLPPFTNWGLDLSYSMWTSVTAWPTVIYSDRTRRSLLSDIVQGLNWERVEYRTQRDSAGHVKTLVLDLEGTLIHTSSFRPHSNVEFVKSSTGLCICKRPGLDIFLRTVLAQFDVFIAAEPDATTIIDAAMPWLPKRHRLQGEGKQEVLNRSKKRLIMVNSSDSISKNTIHVPKWAGSLSDRVLIEWLPPLLTRCRATTNVRTAIQQTADTCLC